MAATADTGSAILEAEVDGEASGEALSPAEVARLRRNVQEATAAIAALLEGRSGPIGDAAAAQELAASLKPYVDRLHAVRELLDPLERIRDNREQITQLQVEIAEDIALVEDASSSGDLPVDEEILTELRSELAAVKRDRKIFVPDDEPEAAETESAVEAGHPPLSECPVCERLRRIFGARFVEPARLGQILQAPFPEAEEAVAREALGAVWKELFETAGLRPHVEAGRVGALRRAFADFALLFRPTHLPGRPGEKGPVPCSIEALRAVFPRRFLPGRAAWYARLGFYREAARAAHWALVDRQYLNVTFKKPKIRLMLYARANELAPGRVHQKSALEDVYDRVVLDAAVGRQFFNNCNSLTRTAYQQARQKSKKQVYVYYGDEQIRISGKRGTPHWRPTRPRWPGVLPSVVFADGFTEQ